jgi:bifunctional NMN adenylyltransferase/nudix hydrolase
VREIYFGRSFNGNEITADHAELLLKAFLPTETITELREFEKTEFYIELREEHLFNVEYRKPYKNAKYPPIFQTVDAIVIQTGHVLLVRRGARPGKGLWALPGGFLNPKERLFDACIRELREETGIKVPEPVLRGSMVFKEDFDYPDRSLRGRTITKGFLFKLPDFVVDGKISLPKVKGADDAEKAWWVPLDEVLKSPELFFEDHWQIITYMLGRL